MSYCRWSSDDFGCDLYCYANVSGGFTTHVASNRVVGEVPKVDWTPMYKRDGDTNKFTAQMNAQSAWLKAAERRPIGLPHDGESSSDPDLPSFLARLEALRAIGYRFPDNVLDAVREEMRDDSHSPRP